MPTNPTPRKYPAGTRSAALKRAKEVGPCAAARELGIPISTLTWWRGEEHRGEQHPVVPARLPADQDGERQERSRSSDRTKPKAALPEAAPRARALRAARPEAEAPTAAPVAEKPQRSVVPAHLPADQGGERQKPSRAGARTKPKAVLPEAVHRARASRAGRSEAEAPPPVLVAEKLLPKAATVHKDASAPVASPQAAPDASRKVARVYTPSERARILDLAKKEGPTAAHRRFGASRFSIHNWLRKVRLHEAGKTEESPVEGSDEDLAARRDARILAEWRAHPGLGPSQLRNQLRRKGMKVSVHTVRCVLDEHGYVSPKVRRRPDHELRYEAVRPNHLWHLDFLHRYIHKQKIYVLLILDDFSRFIVGWAIWDGERVVVVRDTFLEAVGRHGRPEKVMSDGGSAFHAWRGVSEFTRLLEDLEVDQIVATTPQNNGKLENLNGNLQKELFDREEFFDLGHAHRRLAEWIRAYNFQRTHQGLGGMLVPADRYFGRADEVLACVEARRDPEHLGMPIPVAERQLDLFRLVSQGGQLALYLLGHRIALPLVAETPDPVAGSGAVTADGDGAGASPPGARA